jgi:hypothetical protein
MIKKPLRHLHIAKFLLEKGPLNVKNKPPRYSGITHCSATRIVFFSTRQKWRHKDMPKMHRSRPYPFTIFRRMNHPLLPGRASTNPLRKMRAGNPSKQRTK